MPPTDHIQNQRLVLLLVDVAGFAKAARRHGDREVFAMLDAFYHVVEETAAQAHGRLVKVMGDAALLAFPEEHAAAAVACIEPLRTELRDTWRHFGEACEVRVKAHVGDVATGPIGPARHFDVIGETVNELFLMSGDNPTLSPALQALIKSDRGD